MSPAKLHARRLIQVFTGFLPLYSAKMALISAAIPLHLMSCITSMPSKPKVTNGFLDLGDPAVILIQNENPDGTVTYCTASYIKQKVIITAAHCLMDKKTGEIRKIRTVSAKSLKMVNFALHPNYHPSKLNFDVALLQLEAQPPGVVPIEVSGLMPHVGQRVRLVGFGGNQLDQASSKSIGKSSGSGSKRTGFTVVKYLDHHFVYSSGVLSAIPMGASRPTGENCALLEGDSGGPMLDDHGAIIGIASVINKQNINSTTPSITVAHVAIAAIIEFIREKALLLEKG